MAQQTPDTDTRAFVTFPGIWVLTTVALKASVFWNLEQCSLVDRLDLFGRTGLGNFRIHFALSVGISKPNNENIYSYLAVLP